MTLSVKAQIEVDNTTISPIIASSNGKELFWFIIPEFELETENPVISYNLQFNDWVGDKDSVVAKVLSSNSNSKLKPLWYDFLNPPLNAKFYSIKVNKLLNGSYILVADYGNKNTQVLAFFTCSFE